MKLIISKGKAYRDLYVAFQESMQKDICLAFESYTWLTLIKREKY